MEKRSNKSGPPETCSGCQATLWARQLDPVDHLTPLWTRKMGLQGGFGGKRSCALRMSEGLVLLQLDPLDHHFDPEDQAPTLWISAN